MTETQQNIFNAPPPSTSTASQNLPARPTQNTDQAMKDAASPDTRGQKRPRDEEEESDEDVAMEEDSDED